MFLFKGDGLRRDRLINRTFPDNTGRSARRARASGDVALWLVQTDAFKDRVNNALWRDTPGPNYIHFPDWLGRWFYDELTYEERGSDGKWRKPGRGANEAFDLLVYADALAVLHGYEKIRWPSAPDWAQRETWLVGPEERSGLTTSRALPERKEKRRHRKEKLRTERAEDNPWITSGGWL
ncbi:phage terminase large subunit [Escherichia coli]|nr:phage terminase large subunit [Escherichia coli]